MCPKGELARRILRQQAENLLRRTAKMIDGVHGFGPLMSEELAERSIATAYALLQDVSAHESRIERNNREKRVPAEIELFDPTSQRQERANLSFVSVPAQEEKSSQINPFAKMPDVTIRSSKELDRQLDLILREIAVKTSVECKRTLCHQLVDQLPIPSNHLQVKHPFWEQLSIDEAIRTLTSLRSLLLLYRGVANEDVPSRRQATIFSVQALTHFLVTKIDQERHGEKGDANALLKSYQIPFSGRESVLKMKGQIFFDRREYLRVKRAVTYFSEVNLESKKVLFLSEKPTWVEKLSIKEAPDNGVYWFALIYQNKELEKKVREEANRRWPDLTPEEIELDYIAQIKAMDDWLQANKRWDKWIKAQEWGATFPPRPSGKKPPKPHRKANLPEDTKFLMLMEEFIPGEGNPLLNEVGYEHVNFLREVIFISERLQVEELSDDNLICNPKRSGPYNFQCLVKKVAEVSVPSDSLIARALRLQHRCFSEKHQEFFRWDGKNIRHIKDFGRGDWEARSLMLFSRLFTEQPLLKRLMRSLSEWQLTPYQLIAETEYELEKFKEPSFQATFIRLFFRSPVLESGEFLMGVGDLIIREKALIKNCHQFIQSGLSYFEDQRDGKNVVGGRFFFEFSFYLGRYLMEAAHLQEFKEEKERLLEAAEKFNLEKDLARWFKLKSLSEEDRAVLHLYRLLHLSLKKEMWTFMYEPTAALPVATQDLADFYESWCEKQFNLEAVEQRSPMADRFALQQLTDLSIKLMPILHKDSSLRRFICSSVIRSLKLELREMGEWEPDQEVNSSSYTVRFSDKSFWQIDLVTGKVNSSHGLIQKVDSDCPWEKSKSFQRLFSSEKKITYRSHGRASAAFEHPVYGTVRIISRQDGYKFQVQLTEKKRLFECEEISFSCFGIFNRDHVLWVPRKKGRLLFPEGERKGLKGYLTTLSKNEIKYAILDDGEIVEVDAITGNPVEGSRSVDIFQVNKEHKARVSGISQFELSSYILIYSNRRTRAIEEVLFPSYTSRYKNPLRFEQKGANLVWTENRSYRLSKSMPKSHFGTIKSTLTLVPISGVGPQIVLLPFQKIIGQDIPVASGSIDRKNVEPLVGVASKESWGNLRYLTFRVEKGQASPTTLEARLFLAYIHLSQKKYSEAVSILRSIKPTESLPEEGIRVLEFMQDHPLGEDHPDAKMAALHAQIIKIKRMDHCAKVPVDNYFQNDDAQIERLWKLVGYIAKVIQTFDNLSRSCRFSRDDELLLLEKVKREASENIDKVYEKDRLKLRTRKFYLEKINKRIHLIQSGEVLSATKVQPGYRTPEKSRNQENLKEKVGQRIFNLPTLPKLENLEAKSVEKSYEASQRLYLETALPLAIDKIFEGEPQNFPFCSKPHSLQTFQNKGEFFLRMLKIAKSGNLMEVKSALLTLFKWRVNSPKKSALSGYLDLILVILYAPERFLDPINPEKCSPEEVRAFLDSITGAYFGCQDLSSPNDIWSKFFGCRWFGGTSRKAKNLPEKGNFPLLNRLVFNSPSKKYIDQVRSERPLRIDLSQKKSFWKLLEKWKQFGGKNVTVKTSEANLLPSGPAEHSLPQIAETYRENFARDLHNFYKDYEKGRQILDAKDSFIIGREEGEKLQEEAREELERLEELLQRLLSKIRYLANKVPEQKREALSKIARIGGSVDKVVTVESCIDCLLANSSKEFALLNPNLNSDDVSSLSELTLELCDLKSHIAQVKRIIKWSSKALAIRDLKDPVRQQYCQDLFEALDAKCEFGSFDPEVQVILRCFCGETGMIPYKKQLTLIKKMLALSSSNSKAYRDIVAQLIVGGGKTSVIATIILYIAARRDGRLSIFQVPSSLFDTVKINLGNSMSKAFHRFITPLEVSREELTPYRIQQITQLIEEAKRKPVPIIMTISTRQILELEPISLALSIKRRVKRLITSKSSINIPESREKIKRELDKAVSLIKISNEISENGDVLMDEVEVLLSSLKETNFASGETLSLDPLRNQLLLAINRLLISHEVKVPTLPGRPSVASIVRMESNEQVKMSLEIYLNHLTPVIAEKVFETFLPIRQSVPLNFSSSFIRYCSDRISPDLQDIADGLSVKLQKPLSTREHQDVEFLKLFDRLSKSSNKEELETAKLISSTRGFLLVLLKHTLQCSGNRNYGEDPDRPGKIIKYLGVDAPSGNELANPWTEAQCGYQWAVAFKLNPQTVKAHVLSLKASAEHYMKIYGEKFEETAEYEECMELFDVPLDRAHEQEMVEHAVCYTSQNKQHMLSLRAELNMIHTTHHSQNITVNGVSTVEGHGSNRTMSGTPFIAEGLRPSLSDRLVPDEGCEGKILHMLCKKVTPDKIHSITLSSVSELIIGFFEKHQTPQKIRGIIDTAAFFKKFKENKFVAKELMSALTYLQKEGKADPNIEGVLFYHRVEEEREPNTLFVWKKGAMEPEEVGGSSEEALKAKELYSSNYFVYYDETHTVGVDIPQLPDAINLLTFDENILRRSLCQGTMRARLFFLLQEIEILCYADSRHKLVNGGKCIQDLIYTSEGRQTEDKADHMMRLYEHRVSSLFRRKAVDFLFETLEGASLLSDKELVSQIQKCEPFVVSRIPDDPVKLWGKIRRDQDSKKVLQKKLSRKKIKFRKRFKRGSCLSRVYEDVKAMSDQIGLSKVLPKTSLESGSAIGMSQEVVVAVEQDTESQNEVQTAIERELREYEGVDSGSYRQELGLSESGLTDMVSAVRIGSPRANILSLKQQLADYDYRFLGESVPYQNVFSQPVFGTYAFFNASVGEGTLPIFHPLQRPPKQALAIRTIKGSIHWLLLSERETADVQNHLEGLYAKASRFRTSVWLVQSNGKLFKGFEGSPFPPDHDRMKSEIEMGLFEINAFAGDISYLAAHTELAEQWMHSEPELKRRFLRLKVARDSKQSAILASSILFNDGEGAHEKSASFSLCRKRVEREKLRKGSLRPASPKDTKLLKPKDICRLHVDHVQDLGFDLDEKADEYTTEALKVLADRYGNDGRQGARELAVEQFKKLRSFQIPYITPKQMQWLPSHLTSLLKNPKQIYYDNAEGERVYTLGPEQVKSLSKNQEEFIPFINPDLYYLFNKEWQVTAIDSRFLDKINRACLGLVTRKQVEEVSDPEMISRLERIAAGSLGRPKVKPGLWTSWVKLERLKHISEEQVPYLTSNQVPSCPSKFVKFLSPEQVVWINERQALFLEGEQQVSTCPNDYISLLSGPQVQYIPAKKSWYIEEFRQLAFLEKKEQVAGIKPELVPLLKDSQVALISKE